MERLTADSIERTAEENGRVGVIGALPNICGRLHHLQSREHTDFDRVENERKSDGRAQNAAYHRQR